MTYTIEKITTLIGARRYGAHEGNIRWLLTDSRSLCFPEETLFFALHSKRNDGHRYIDDLYRRGVRAFVVESVPDHPDVRYPDACFLKVVNTLAALQRLAERHRDEFNIPIVGITGSNGKTMVKEWLYQILSGVGCWSAADENAALSQSAAAMPHLRVTRSPRSYNSQIGVPLSVWLLNEQTQVGLFEAGISQPGEMLALHDIIQPTIGVLTSLGAAHQENFRSMEEKCMEKLQLFHDTEAIVYCSDDDIVSRCIRRSHYQGRRLSWSRYNQEAPVFIAKSEVADGRCHITYVYQGNTHQYAIPFIDEASVDNSITTLVVALYLGMSPDQIAARMPYLEPVAMRLEVKQGQHNCILINDSYNSDIHSLDIALDFMSRRQEAGTSADGQPGQLSRTLILSDIDQSGEQPSVLYAEVAQLAAKRGVTKLIGIGHAISSQQHLIQTPQKHFFADTQQFIASPEFRQLHHELILLKGSRRFGFDQLAELLEEKVHETILEVNLDAMVDNLNYYRSFLKPDTKLVCMIKADGYGAGAVEIAKTLQEHRVDYLAVAVADEGVTLRKAGITSNILVMNPEMTAFKTMFDYDLEPEVYSFRLLDALIKAARKEGITGWPVHIKLDTGMHRLGFKVADVSEQASGASTSDIPELISRLKHQQAIIPRSVFSHFVGSDSDDFDRFSARQYELFLQGSSQLQAAFSHHIIRHIDNSAGIEHFPERQLDMCRLGLGLYGIDPRDNRILHTVSTLKTTILQLRRVPKEETVGYSRKGRLQRDSLIAAIPIGYADGLNRRLGRGNCYCLVNGQKAPYVGNICMDVAMIDVTGIDCREGDQVEIFGDHLPVTVLSDVLETIPYEVLTGVSNRVKRVYFSS